ncbi:MAG: hypothetical protein FWF12_07355 [Betaproteobacteria bacterium]|nr:hypothetical protein [Betaproteobacteria bacterium]
MRRMNMSGLISRLVSAPSAVSVFVRQHTTERLRRVGFPVVLFVVIAAVVWWGLMGQTIGTKRPLAPDLGNGGHLLPDTSASANDAPPADSALLASSESLESPVSAPVVHQDRISSLLASHRARAVYSGKVNGKRRVKVEFLTKKGSVSDTYSENALSREGWDLSINSNKRTALLKKADQAHSIPLVDNSSSKKSKRKSNVAAKSKVSPTSDHVGVGYLKISSKK